MEFVRLTLDRDDWSQHFTAKLCALHTYDQLSDANVMRQINDECLAEMWAPITEWLVERNIKYRQRTIGLRATFGFPSLTDAVHFKLRWY